MSLCDALGSWARAPPHPPRVTLQQCERRARFEWTRLIWSLGPCSVRWIVPCPPSTMRPLLSDAAIAAFLDATAFVVDGAAMQMPFALVDPDHRLHELTFRDWGHQTAAWANRTFPAHRGAGDPRSASSPCGRSQCDAAGPDDWLYIDFYMHRYTSRFFADYDRWVETLERVVRRKVDRFGPPFAR